MTFYEQIAHFQEFPPQHQQWLDFLEDTFAVRVCEACEEDKTSPGHRRCIRCEQQNLTSEDWS